MRVKKVRVRAAGAAVLAGLALVVVLLAARGAAAEGDIIGGQEATPGDYPWQVALVSSSAPADNYFRQVFCGGSIIADSWVVTAAHCVFDRSGSLVSPSSFFVVAGMHELAGPSAGAVRVDVAELIPYPAYGKGSHDHDIALLRLAQPVAEREPSPDQLPIAYIRPAPGDVGSLVGLVGTVTGWGNRDYIIGDPPDVLYEVDVPIISNFECSGAYDGLTDNMVCAGYSEGGKDACQGDSGGPLVAEVDGSTYLVGVVSWGKDCALEGFPGVYARVSRYADWVDAATKPFDPTDFLFMPFAAGVR